MADMKQIASKDYDKVSDYFIKFFENKRYGYLDPYTSQVSEFSAFYVKDNMFNYRRLYYTNESFTEIICLKLRKKPFNSLAIDIIFFDVALDDGFVGKLNTVFDDIKLNYEEISKININLLEKESSDLTCFLQELNFECEVTYSDELGFGKNVLVYSRLL